MKASQEGKGAICWATEDTYGLHQEDFMPIGDGKFHTVNIDLSDHESWKGKLIAFGIRPASVSGTQVQIREVAIAKEPSGAPDLSVRYFGMADAINRTGMPRKLIAVILNGGGETARKCQSKARTSERLSAREGRAHPANPRVGVCCSGCGMAIRRWSSAGERQSYGRDCCEI